MNTHASRPTPLHLADIHLRTLYVHDARSRLVGINEPSAGAAPRFILARTPRGNVWRFGAQLSAELERGLEALARTEPIENEPPPEPHRLRDYLALASEHEPIQSVWMGPAYLIANSTPKTSPSVTVQHVDAARAHTLDAEFAESRVQLLARQPLIALTDAAGAALSVCYTARATPLAHEAGVDTAVQHRGKGYAPHAVAAWARAIRALGRLPLYSTSWSNTASRAVASKLGMQRYAVTFSVT